MKMVKMFGLPSSRSMGEFRNGHHSSEEESEEDTKKGKKKKVPFKWQNQVI